jgi:hypothetical protein
VAGHSEEGEVLHEVIFIILAIVPAQPLEGVIPPVKGTSSPYLHLNLAGEFAYVDWV